MQRYRAQITYHKTHSCYQASLHALMPLVFMSNLLKYASGPDAKQCYSVYILNQIMLDGCNMHNLNYSNLVMVHRNIVFHCIPQTRSSEPTIPQASGASLL